MAGWGSTSCAGRAPSTSRAMISPTACAAAAWRSAASGAVAPATRRDAVPATQDRRALPAGHPARRAGGCRGTGAAFRLGQRRDDGVKPVSQRCRAGLQDQRRLDLGDAPSRTAGIALQPDGRRCARAHLLAAPRGEDHIRRTRQHRLGVTIRSCAACARDSSGKASSPPAMRQFRHPGRPEIIGSSHSRNRPPGAGPCAPRPWPRPEPGAARSDRPDGRRAATGRPSRRGGDHGEDARDVALVVGHHVTPARISPPRSPPASRRR